MKQLGEQSLLVTSCWIKMILLYAVHVGQYMLDVLGRSFTRQTQYYIIVGSGHEASFSCGSYQYYPY